ncbi:MAG: DUF1925 domain-containing protein [Candidatus Lokiarchaeota archaeon]|nr:DUF1925 domain-containing protein [Candidatus Lokiarchaeota archaeon]MBD3341356.1 DUF1925 domain-containing protein [Candidatus Lokiarchaeota archaeon]
MTEKTIYFPIVFHFHQPIDNFPWVIEDSYKKAYKPLVENMYDYPEIKFTLHISGFLLNWFLENKPDLIQKLKEMAKRDQIELIGGGFYEPIFAIIPTRDKIAQIKKLSESIKREFGLEVSGAWLSERVWEPHYPSFLSDAGLKYIIVDDNHLRSSGITQEDTFYTYITEDEGKSLRIFPINEKLRYLMPWKPTYNSIDYLKENADKIGNRMALSISDAEKMGVWGSTHEICYVEGHGHWDGDNHKPFIPTLFQKIKENEWIKSITLSKYISKYPAKSLVYLPTSTYDKMEEWVLPTEIRRDFKKIRKSLKDDQNKQREYQFLKGGFWRYFLVKYPESNNMHKKMLHVREKIISVEDKISDLKDSELAKKLRKKCAEAWEEVYKAQTNDCYWHGMFGGIYLQFLRFSVYTHLINAENLIDEMTYLLYPKLNLISAIIPKDLTKDSQVDYLIETDDLNLYVDPAHGGTIFELDYKQKSYNLLNTLTRWPEAYHEKEKIEDNSIKVDRFRRSMLRTRILKKESTLEDILSDKYEEFGDFLDGKFEVVKSEKDGKFCFLKLVKDGSIRSPTSDKTLNCIVTKSIHTEDKDISINYSVKFKDNDEADYPEFFENLVLGIDFPFFFNGNPKEFSFEGNSFEAQGGNDNEILKAHQYMGSELKAVDKTYSLMFEIKILAPSNNVAINLFPLISYTYTDEGYKEIFQGFCACPLFSLEKNLSIDLKLNITEF